MDGLLAGLADRQLVEVLARLPVVLERGLQVPIVGMLAQLRYERAQGVADVANEAVIEPHATSSENGFYVAYGPLHLFHTGAIQERHPSREPVTQLALVVVGKQRLGRHDQPQQPHLVGERVDLISLFEQVGGHHQLGDSLEELCPGPVVGPHRCQQVGPQRVPSDAPIQITIDVEYMELPRELQEPPLETIGDDRGLCMISRVRSTSRELGLSAWKKSSSYRTLR